MESNFSINNFHPGGGAAGDDDDDDDGKLVVLMQLLVYNYDRYTKVL